MLPRDTDVADGGGAASGELRARLVGIARHWRLVLAVTAVAVVGTYVGSSMRPTQYRASADLRVETGTLRDELHRFGSSAVVAAVGQHYKGPLDPAGVHATPAPDEPDVLRASAVGRHPAALSALVNSYVASFVDLRRSQQIDDLRAQETTASRQLDRTTAQLDTVRRPLDAIQAQLAAQPANAGLAAQRDALAARLAPQLTPLTSQQAALQAQLESLDAQIQATYSGGYAVERAAAPPTDAVAPRPARNAGVALVLGLFVSAVIAAAIDSVRQRHLGGVDLDQLTGGLPVLGHVPFVVEEVAVDHVAVRDDPLGVLATAYRSLAAALDEARGDARVVQVTSSAAGEGKTTAVANLAEALAIGGRRVGVVCGDLRRPRLEACLGVAPAPGLSDVLLGEVALAAALQGTAAGVVVLPSGTAVTDPAELLAGERLVSAVRDLAARVDVVLVDCPPVLPVADALLEVRLAEATVVIADVRTTERKALTETLAVLHQVGAEVLGLVLNSLAAPGPEGAPQVEPHLRLVAPNPDDRPRTFAS